MKKTLIAAAALAVAGAASAQVTLSGKVGYGLQSWTGQQTQLAVTDGGLAISATEDLGGGMKVSFSQAFQGAFGDATTSTAFVQPDGGSIVLSGGFGTMTLMEVPADTDNLGVGNTPKSMNHAWGTTADRYTAWQYDLPAMSGLTVGVRLAGSNGAVASSATPDLRLAYASGPLSVAFNARSGASKRSETTVKYDLGFAKVAYFMDITTTAAKRKEASISAPLGAVSVGLSYGTRSDGIKGTEADLQYALSKRTMIRASMFSASNASITESTRVKLFHTF